MDKLITKETGVSIALMCSIVGMAVYVAVFASNLRAEVETLKDQSADIKNQILGHETTDKETFTKIDSTVTTKTESDLRIEVINTKIDNIAKDVKEIKDIITKFK